MEREVEVPHRRDDNLKRLTLWEEEEAEGREASLLEEEPMVLEREGWDEMRREEKRRLEAQKEHTTTK